MALPGSEQLLITKIKADLLANGYPVADPAFTQMWTIIVTDLFAHIVANGGVVIPIGAVQVQGTAAAQSNLVPVLGSLT